MLAALRFLLLVIAIGYVGIAAFMYVQQRNMQYFPANKGLTPADVGLEGVSEETIRTPDGESIIAWHAPAEQGKPTILFFHGNGGEVSDRAKRLAFYRDQGFGALFVSYRGYGKSSGSVSEQGFITDAAAAYDWLVAKGLGARDIAIVGESLGTGVAVQTAARKPVLAMALEAPYTATLDVAAAAYWWLPVRLLMKDTFLSRDFISGVRAPLLVQHGEADTVIPFAQGRKLFELANEPKEFVAVAGAGHDAIHDAALWQRETDFFSRQMFAAQ